jgi:hypothetical protein
MGQLTNLYVSQSYQGLIKLANSATGVTGTLQYTQDGVGNNLPIQISTSSVNITGSFTINGQPISVDTGSLVTTASFNAFTASIDGRVDALELETGSLQSQINQKLNTSSFNSYTSSNDSKVNSLIASTGSYATTSSLTALSQSIATTDLSQNNRLTALEGVTGSINRNGLITTGSIGGEQSITGSLNVTGEITALSASITYLETIYQTSSVLFSSGSNILGDEAGDTQTLWGAVRLPSGQLSVTGSVRITESGSAFGDALLITSGNLRVDRISNYNTDLNISALAGGELYLNGANNSIILKNSFNNNIISIDGDTEVTGTLKVTNGITGSLQGTASYATQALSSSWSNVSLSSSFAFQANTASYATNALSSSHAINADTASFFNGSVVSASFAENANTASYIKNGTLNQDLDINGSLTASNFRVENNTWLDGTLRVTNDARFDTHVEVVGAAPSFKLRDTSGGGFSSGYDLRVDTGSFEIYDDTHNRDVLSDFFNLATSKHTTSLTSEIIIISGSDSVTIQGPLTASLQDGYVWVGNSSNKNTNIATSSLSVASAVSASFATNALTASFALNGGGGGSVDTGSFATTGSNTFNGNQTINGIVNINNPIATGNINLQVESGSFTKTAINLQAEKSFIQAQGDLFFLNTWDANSSGSINFQSPNQINFLATSSVTISGSNNVTIRSSNIDVTGSLKVTAGITGSLEGTASYATNALTASFALNGGGGSVDTGSLMRTGSVVGNVLTFTKGDGTTFDLTVATGSGGGSVDTGSFATTGSNIFKGNQVISGSLIGNSLNDGIIFIGSEAYESGSVKANISSSNAISQSNIFFGATTGPAAANLTGSIVISGSNNIMMGGPRPSTIATVGTYGYIGNTNLMMGQSTLSTGSILRPVVNSNIIAGAGTLGMIFTSSSVAGGQPSFTANIINSNFNSNMGASGSISAGGNIINGATTLIQTGSALANLRSTFNNNNINSTFTVQNYQSSSFTVNNNNTVGASHFIDNRFVNTFGTAGITVSRNFFQGQLNYLNIGGTPSSNTTRAAGDSFFGGFNVTGSLLATGTNNGNLSATLIYGNNLNINGTSVANVGGNAFFGRYNDTGSLANSNDIVMAVGTGTAVSTRRTGFYITTGSLVGISGSLDVKGNTTITGSVVLSGSVGPELIVVGDSVLSGSVYGAVNALSISSNTASLNLASGNFFTLALPTGVNTFVSASNVLPGQTINLAITNGGTGTISFSNNVKQPSGSFYTATTGSGVVDVVTLLSVDTNNLYMNNVKNLI